MLKELLKKLFKKGSITCPHCGINLIPLPLYDGDTVNSEQKELDPRYIHFSCCCGYIFARQDYKEFKFFANWGCKAALNYPIKDYGGEVLPRRGLLVTLYKEGFNYIGNSHS